MAGFRGNNIPKISHANHASHWFMSELTHRVVAKSGIPDDQYHIGKIILQSLKDDPQFVLQINGATGESENFESVLKRTVQCANGLRKLGAKTGDVMILIAPTHLDLTIPFYAGFCLGLTTAPIDLYLKVQELEDLFHMNEPKFIFCEMDRLNYVIEASANAGIKPEIISFGKSDQVLSFTDFLNNYGQDVSVEDFRASDFDPDTTKALLISTSGTTGKPKLAIATYKSFAITIPFLWIHFTKFPTPTRLVLIVSPIQWMTAIMGFTISAIMRYTRVHSSLPMTQEHTYEIINKYKPTYMILTPELLATLLRPGDRDRCDFSCFDVILSGGSSVHISLIKDLKKITPKTEIVCAAYGMSEAASMIFTQTKSTPSGSLGERMALFQYRLVDLETGKDIEEPHVPGELRIQGPSLFKGYSNNIEATTESFDGEWFKTGDIIYRDENFNHFFVDRLKVLLKYKCNQISPAEVEDVIKQHPSVQDVAVVGIPDLECGELIVACVVRLPGKTVTAQEIKDIVKNTLTDSKQLRGGVIFMNELPMTTNMKVARHILTEMVQNSPRE